MKMLTPPLPSADENESMKRWRLGQERSIGVQCQCAQGHGRAVRQSQMPKDARPGDLAILVRR
jgi:hypothetical protein